MTQEIPASLALTLEQQIADTDRVSRGDRIPMSDAQELFLKNQLVIMVALDKLVKAHKV